MAENAHSAAKKSLEYGERPNSFAKTNEFDVFPAIQLPLFL